MKVKCVCSMQESFEWVQLGLDRCGKVWRNSILSVLWGLVVVNIVYNQRLIHFKPRGGL